MEEQPAAGTITEDQLAVIEAALDAIGPDSRQTRSPAQRLALVVLARRLSERLQALSALLVAEADAVGATQIVYGTPTTSWLALVEHTTTREAAGALRTGEDIDGDERLRDATLDGRVRVRQARAIAKTLSELPGELSDEQRADAAEILIDRARVESSGQLGCAVQEVLAEVAPELMPQDPAGVAEVRRRLAWTRRSLRFSSDGQGSTLFWGSLPELEAAPLKKLVAAYRESDRRRGRDERDPLAEERTPDQRNADALIALIADHERAASAPGVAGDRPRVVVTMSHDLLAAGVEQAGILDSGEQISAGELRRMCCDADITPVVLGGASELLDFGTTHRLVPPSLRRALSLRDGGCVFPGCTQPDASCEAHHVTPWWCDGPTSLENLILLCPHHHGLVEPPRFFSGSSPPDRWEVGLGADGLPEIRPPTRLDPQRQPLRHERFRRRKAG